MTSKRIIARFQPQAWVNDYAVDVDPDGEVEFDVTSAVTKRGKAKALLIEDDQYDSDDLRTTRNAPEWIRDWSGPFYITVADSIKAYYENLK